MISQTAEYALRAIIYLAGQQAVQSPTTAQISQATQVPSNYLAKVLRRLSRAGLVHSQRGPGGGHKLTQNPAELTVLQVLNAVDPFTRIQSCPLHNDHDSMPGLTVDPFTRIQSCPLGLEHQRDLCPLHRRLESAMAMVEEAFDKTTVAELVTDPTGKKGTCQFPCASLVPCVPSEATVASR